MRKATNKGNWIYNDSNSLIGVSTGFDFCAEHECGIKELQNLAGILNITDYLHIPKRSFFSFKKRELEFGLDRTTIKNKDYIWFGDADLEDGSKIYLFGYNVKNKIPTNIDPDFDAFWDERSFLIASKDEEKIRSLADAATNNDLAYTTGGKVFDNHAGIRLVIKSKVSKEIFDKCKNDDIEVYDLLCLNQKIDIQSILRKHKCNFYACSPRWKDYKKKEIQWWLNPENQKYHNAGYFTYSELIDWTKGKGPVLK